MKYTVLVDDNFHYMDEHESCVLGEFEALEDAVTKAGEIVDEFLLHAYQRGMTAEQLYQQYTSFGEDPYIAGGPPESTFSAWSYAKKRCQEICSKGQPPQDPAGIAGDPRRPSLFTKLARMARWLLCFPPENEEDFRS